MDHSKLDRGDRITMKVAGAPEGDFRDWETIGAWADQIAKSSKTEMAGSSRR